MRSISSIRALKWVFVWPWVLSGIIAHCHFVALYMYNVSILCMRVFTCLSLRRIMCVIILLHQCINMHTEQKIVAKSHTLFPLLMLMLCLSLYPYVSVYMYMCPVTSEFSSTIRHIHAQHMYMHNKCTCTLNRVNNDSSNS